MSLHIKIITGKAVGVRGNDIDTDRIIPARYMRAVTFDGLGEHLFEDDRRWQREMGKTHALDKPACAGAEILFANKNFACGSSREHAPQAILRWGGGIKAIVGESFAEIFFGNCVALGIPCVAVAEGDMEKIMTACESNPDAEFTVDLESMTLRYGGESVAIHLDEGARRQFLDGRWDATAELFEAGDAIGEAAAKLPYFNSWE